MKSDKGIYKIDGFQAAALLTTLVAATAVLFDPRSLSKIAGHDGWLAIFIVTISGAYLIYVYYRLSTLFPGQTLIEYLPSIVGKVVGKIIGLAYMLVFIQLTNAVFNEALIFLYGTGVFMVTPQIIVGLFIVIATTYGVSSGIEVIGRTLSVYWVILGLFFTLFIAMALPFMKFEVLLPVGEAGWSTIVKSSIFPHALRGELFVMLMLFPYCRSSREGFIAGNIANIMISTFIIISTIACVAALGVEVTARSYFGPFLIADFIQPVGIKILLVTVWIIAFWGKLALLQFTITDGITQLLNLKEHRPVILPIAIILLVFSLTPNQSATAFFEYSARTLPGGMLFGYVIPTLLLIIAQIKARFHAKSEAPQNSLPGPN